MALPRTLVYRPREEGADEDSTRWVTGLHQRHGYRDERFISRRLCDAFKLVCVEAPPAAQLANFAEVRVAPAPGGGCGRVPQRFAREGRRPASCTSAARGPRTSRCRASATADLPPLFLSVYFSLPPSSLPLP